MNSEENLKNPNEPIRITINLKNVSQVDINNLIDDLTPESKKIPAKPIILERISEEESISRIISDHPRLGGELKSIERFNFFIEGDRHTAIVFVDKKSIELLKDDID